MKYKRIIINIYVILFAFLLFIIWYRNSFEKDAKATASFIPYYKVYLITMDKEYQYWDYINQGASDFAKAVGIQYVWDAPQKRSAARQIDIIRKAVDDGANAILVAADDPKKISGVIEDAKARGVKVIYVDSPANEEAVTTLATDNYQAGEIAGQTMLSELSKKGIESGSIGIISVQQKQNTELREAGFRKVLTEDGRFNLLDTYYTIAGEPAESQRAAERMIDNNTDLVGLFGDNEGTSEGVGYAINAKNKDIIGIGFDKTDTMLLLLQNGDLKAIMVQNPYTMGYLGMAEAVAAILGKNTGPSYFNTGVTVLNSDEVPSGQ